jgi:hypothetical protein
MAGSGDPVVVKMLSVGAGALRWHAAAKSRTIKLVRSKGFDFITMIIIKIIEFEGL